MIFLLVLLPATGLTIAGYFVLYLSSRTDGALRTFGRYLGFWAFTLAGRYSAKLWTTLDNTDVNPNTYQGFAAWFVADAHVHARLNRNWNAGLGVDNLLNRKYFLFHPFPQRTVVASLGYTF